MPAPTTPGSRTTWTLRGSTFCAGACNYHGAVKDDVATLTCTFYLIGAGQLQPGVVAYDDGVVAAFPSREQRPKNHGHLIVVPRQHCRNLYDADDDLLSATVLRVRELAKVVQRTFGATGTTIRQNNEQPGQDTFHLHFHVIPRFEGDEMLLPPVEPVSDANLFAQVAQLQAAVQALRDIGGWPFD